MKIDARDLTTLIYVFDMPTSLAFYRDVLGFEIIGRSEPGDETNWCWLRLGEASLMLNTAYEADRRPPAPDPAAHAVHGDTQLFIACANLEETGAYLKANGIEVSGPELRPFGMWQMHLRDPDGYRICFQRRADGAG